MFEELQELINNIGVMSTQMGMTAQEFQKFLQDLASIPVSFSGLELDDDKIFVIPSSLDKPVKLVLESEENEAFQNCVNAIIDTGEGYPMTSEEIRLALDENDDCYTDALKSIFSDEQKGRYQIDFDS